MPLDDRLFPTFQRNPGAFVSEKRVKKLHGDVVFQTRNRSPRSGHSADIRLAKPPRPALEGGMPSGNFLRAAAKNMQIMRNLWIYP